MPDGIAFALGVLCGAALLIALQKKVENARKAAKRDGYKECWKEMAKFTDDDFDKPLLKDLSGLNLSSKKGKILKNHKYFMDEITYDDLEKSAVPPKGKKAKVNPKRKDKTNV